MPNNGMPIWCDSEAEEAARFHASVFPGSEVVAIHRSPRDNPGNKAGHVMMVEFPLCGIPCIGLNRGPRCPQSKSFSFEMMTEDQDETDRYWNATVGNGGEASACGWCKDRWGVSWQIRPRTLIGAVAAGGEEAKRTFAAMMTMQRIDVATLDAAGRS